MAIKETLTGELITTFNVRTWLVHIFEETASKYRKGSKENNPYCK